MDLTKYFQFSGMWLRRRRFIDDPDDDYDGNPVLIFATPPAIYPCVAPSDPNNIFSDLVGEIYVTGNGFEPKVYKDIFVEYGLGRISFLLVDAWGDRKVIPLVENLYDAPEPFFEHPYGDYSGLLNNYHGSTYSIVPSDTTEIFASCSPPEDNECDEDCIPFDDGNGNLLCVCKDDTKDSEIDAYDYQPLHQNTFPARIFDNRF